MTIPYAFGFDDVYEDSDLRSQGWVHGSGVTGTGFALGLPSQNGRPGRMIVTNTTATQTGLPGDGLMDTGVFNTGYTARQLWTAGGFSIGARLRCNSNSQNLLTQGLTVSATSTGNYQFCWDGVRLWALRRANNSATANVLSYSTDDGATWTDVSNPAGWTTWDGYGLWALAPGVVITHFGVGASGGIVAGSNIGRRFTLSSGVWDTFVNTSAFAGGCTGGYATNTGDAVFPYLVAMNGTTTANTGGVYVVPAAGGTPTLITQTQQSSTTVRWLVMKYLNGRAIACTNASPSTMYSSTTPSTQGTWTSLSLVLATINVQPSDITYFNGAWLLTAIGGGIFRCTAADPTASAANWTRVQTTSVAMYGISASGTRAVAVGNNGGLYVSSDGITWTNLTAQRVNYANTLNKNVVWNGSKFVGLFTSTCVVATSPEGNNWTPVYVPEITPNGSTNQQSMFGVYFATSASWNGATGTFTQASANGMYARIDLLSGSNRPIGLATATNSTPQTLPTINANVGTTRLKYVELVAIATANTNEFNVSLVVDGTTVTSGPVVFGASSSDTTALAIINMLPRALHANAVDDMVFTVFSGATNTVNPGPLRIVPFRSATNVQSQWTKNGVAASNALSVTQPALSQQDGNSVQSTVPGNKDIYGLGAQTVTGTVYGIKVSGYLNTLDSASAANLGIRSSGTENKGSDIIVASASPAYASQMYEVNPATGGSWTPSTAINSQLTLTDASTPFSPSLSMTHFNGTTGQTSIQDSAASQIFWVANGTSSGGYGALNTGAAKFGTAGLRFQGTAGYWTLPNAAFDPGAGVFTIECWFRNINLAASYYPIFGLGPGNTGSYAGLFVCSNGVIGSTTGSSWSIIGASIGANVLDGNWHHVAIVRDGSNVITAYCDGVIASQNTVPGAFAGSMNNLFIGGSNASTAGSFDLDELRYNKSVIYTGPFTPPTGPFP